MIKVSTTTIYTLYGLYMVRMGQSYQCMPQWYRTLCGPCLLKRREQSHKCHKAPVPFHTRQHFVAEICTFLLQNDALGYISRVRRGICEMGLLKRAEHIMDTELHDLTTSSLFQVMALHRTAYWRIYVSLALDDFNKHRLTLAWISNHTPSKAWDEITCPFPNFNGCSVEVLEWIRNFILHSITDVITFPC